MCALCHSAAAFGRKVCCRSSRRMQPDAVIIAAVPMIQTRFILFDASHGKISRPGKNARKGRLIEAATQDSGNRIRSIAIEYDHRRKTTVAKREAWIDASAH